MSWFKIHVMQVPQANFSSSILYERVFKLVAHIITLTLVLTWPLIVLQTRKLVFHTKRCTAHFQQLCQWLFIADSWYTKCKMRQSVLPYKTFLISNALLVVSILLFNTYRSLKKDRKCPATTMIHFDSPKKK